MKKKSEKNFKDGKRDGSSVMWYENGQKMEERHVQERPEGRARNSVV